MELKRIKKYFALVHILGFLDYFHILGKFIVLNIIWKTLSSGGQ